MSGVSTNSLRVWLAAIAVIVFAGVVVAGGIATAYYFRHESLPAPAPKQVPLQGRLTIVIGKPAGNMRKIVPLSDPQALPVKAGDMMYLEVRYDDPAHSFIVWQDTTGRFIPLYPWNMDDLENRDFQVAPPACRDSKVLLSPMTIGKGWMFEKGTGMVTVLLLGRKATNGDTIDFAKLLGSGAPTKTRDPAELAIFQLNRSAATVKLIEARNRGNEAETAEADRSLLQLMERLHTEFDLVQAVRFAQVED